jgi:hypothetical protein
MASKNSLSHLSPKEVGYPEHVTTMDAPAKQPDEHGEKQGDVGSKQSDDAEFTGVGIKTSTFRSSRYPGSTKLKQDKING